MVDRVLLYLTFSKFPGRMAQTVQVAKMSEAMAREDIRVNVAGLAGSTSPEQADFRLHLLTWRPRLIRNRALVLYSGLLIRRLSPGVVFSRITVLALKAAERKCKTILELHALPEPDSRRARALEELLPHPNLRRIVTISQALADDLVAEYGLPHAGCDIVVAHDGADAGPRPGPMPSHDGPITVGYFGHLYPGKGMETIAALAQLLPAMRFEVYGGTESDLAHWRAACAAQANLTLHGYISHAEVTARMAECDILIAPYAAHVSHAGGGDIGRWMSPLKLFEYMAAEWPIVTSDLPVLREVVRDGQTALLCAPEDPAAFADALTRLAADRELRDRLGKAGRDLLEAEYTWDQRARRVLEGVLPPHDA